MTKSDFAAEVAAVMRAMDDSGDTAGAIREVMLAVYTAGAKHGALEGYDAGWNDRVRSERARQRPAGDGAAVAAGAAGSGNSASGGQPR